MKRHGWHTIAVALGFILASSGPALAERVRMVRTEGQKGTGARVDKTVPYGTNGKTAFGAYTVAPLIYKSPVVDDPANPQAKPVYNLIFYGAKQAAGDQSFGATPK
jgi:hypothetical protein